MTCGHWLFPSIVSSTIGTTEMACWILSTVTLLRRRAGLESRLSGSCSELEGGEAAAPELEASLRRLRPFSDSDGSESGRFRRRPAIDWLHDSVDL
jgi:hypothetical protein